MNNFVLCNFSYSVCKRLQQFYVLSTLPVGVGVGAAAVIVAVGVTVVVVVIIIIGHSIGVVELSLHCPVSEPSIHDQI